MKNLVSVLSESPFYFTMNLRDRHVLVKRLLAAKEQGQEHRIDLSRYEMKVSQFLEIEKYR